MKKSLWPFCRTRKATAKWRPYAPRGTNTSTYDNFRSMKLLKRERVVDEQGRWWLIETRQDISTGVKIRRTERITD